ncbi:MAG: hypothetical protein QM796_18180 [Chthoniobacteraceae bacterium]
MPLPRLLALQPHEFEQADLRDGEAVPRTVTTSAGMIASVSGILIFSVVPCPGSLLISTEPPIARYSCARHPCRRRGRRRW